ncbi:hypothetical protein [Acidihalobacter ferrooxydans]|uniref:Uncharacterized protein n=1 Tax=Acidihalobacter ferrooxydans TaxID=1765967 RepID=A0A1P8UEF2_9GAMM|nr:hypothetical protein [Acidihalobacter ferrooxydans]APZ42169.1 hypothetical protein BW247_02900 [Acidihalobacter ferrooxydans]
MPNPGHGNVVAGLNPDGQSGEAMIALRFGIKMDFVQRAARLRHARAKKMFREFKDQTRAYRLMNDPGYFWAMDVQIITNPEGAR